MSSTIEIQKTCEWCHSVFIARKCSTKYCCKRCAERAYKDGKRKEHVEREQRKAKMPKKVDESPFITPAQCADLIGVSEPQYTTILQKMLSRVSSSRARHLYGERA